jgi:hypothetical protein
MTTHLIAEPTAAVTTPDPAVTAPGWLALSAVLTDEVPVIADREDLLVTVAPGAGHGAPACFLPAHATIELDGTHLGSVDPATATPHNISDRARYAIAWGLLTHECAHARHSSWQPASDAPPGAVAAALLLEESRIEAAQIRRRPDDRHWLRASATNLILADTRADNPAHAPAMTLRDAAHTAALLLARTDAGILTSEIGLKLLENPQGLYRRCNDQQRRMLNQAIFHGLYVDDDNITDYSLHEPFARLHAVQQARQTAQDHEPPLGASTEQGNTHSAAPGRGAAECQRMASGSY